MEKLLIDLYELVSRKETTPSMIILLIVSVLTYVAKHAPTILDSIESFSNRRLKSIAKTIDLDSISAIEKEVLRDLNTQIQIENSTGLYLRKPQRTAIIDVYVKSGGRLSISHFVRALPNIRFDFDDLSGNVMVKAKFGLKEKIEFALSFFGLVVSGTLSAIMTSFLFLTSFSSIIAFYAFFMAGLCYACWDSAIMLFALKEVTVELERQRSVNVQS